MSSVRTWIGGRGLYLYSQIVRYTARYHVLGKEHLDDLDAAGRSAIWTSWHGVTMMVSGYLFRHFTGNEDKMLIIVPDDWRGDTLAEWIRISGGTSFAVSMEENSLLAARRFLQLVREAKKGKSVYLNPDGPDGPSGVPKPGLAFLAGRSGAAILPMGLYTASRMQLSRWDRYSLPFPFSRITLLFGEPLTIAPDEDLEVARDHIAAAINQAMAEAEARH
jgi:lysophospholipid acyltransferase (LPLAT)-like uncharacterized protein